MCVHSKLAGALVEFGLIRDKIGETEPQKSRREVASFTSVCLNCQI